jgi:hypothetical protein
MATDYIGLCNVKSGSEIWRKENTEELVFIK